MLLCAAPVASCGGGSSAETTSTAVILTTPPMPRPAYLKTVLDPVFGTKFTKVTDPGQRLAAGISCDLAYCRHRYSSTQAWNADQSLLVITNGCNGTCFLDGRTYKAAFRRSLTDDCKWHPANPKVMICVNASKIYIWTPRTNEVNVVYAPVDYTKISFGPYKGNPSNNGNLIVVRATNRAGSLVAFAYDLAANKKYPDIDVSGLPGTNEYCGISPSGKYVLCLQTLPDGVETAHVFTIEGAQIQHWTEHHRPAHGDMTLDADGSDVIVGISKADPDKWHVIKRRLTDGTVTNLAPAGYATHASVRNINQPGWAILSYEGSHSDVTGSSDMAPFYREVVALRIDGSGEIRRIVQTRNAESDYYSETHASPSPDGSQIIWSSNWGEAGGPVTDYVARVGWPNPSGAR